MGSTTPTLLQGVNVCRKDIHHQTHGIDLMIYQGDPLRLGGKMEDDPKSLVGSTQHCF
jgi:hypothetical protein